MATHVGVDEMVRGANPLFRGWAEPAKFQYVWVNASQKYIEALISPESHIDWPLAGNP